MEQGLVVILKDKDFPRGLQHWVKAKNGLVIDIRKYYLTSVSKSFFAVTSCTVAVTEFMDHVIIHNGSLVKGFITYARPIQNITVQYGHLR